jgi:hypothetical protein
MLGNSCLLRAYPRENFLLRFYVTIKIEEEKL